MSLRLILLPLFALLMADLVLVQSASAQSGPQTVIGTPFNTVNDSFFERIGMDFGFSLPGARPGSSGVVGLNPDGSLSRSINFNQGGFGSTIPPFGGYDPNASARTGFAVRGKGATFGFQFEFGQGSTRTFTSQTPMVVIPNGGFGSVSDTSLQPFVTGIIPVVGRFHPPMHMPPMVYTSPLAERVRRLQQQGGYQRSTDSPAAAKKQVVAAPVVRSSTADRGDLSVAEIRRRNKLKNAVKEEALQQEIAVRIERAKGAEAKGKLGAAKVFYRQAASRAAGKLKQQLLEKIEALSSNK